MSPPLCAPHAPDARRPLLATRRITPPWNLARMLTAGVPAHRHGDVDNSIDMSAHLHIELLAQPT